MIDIDWLSDRLCNALRWQLANPGAEDGQEIPMAGRRLWAIFTDLNATRASGMEPSPISYHACVGDHQVLDPRYACRRDRS
jgi:hypothetical protein